MPVAIEVNNLSVSYRMVKSMSLRKLIARGAWRNAKFQALKNVSFTVEEGEILGIIGANGGGKSTLLRVLGGIFSPDKGSYNLFGRRISLLAIGVGFERNLSGRTNIMLAGMLMGFTKQEIEAHMEQIIAFSELGDFIDKPVKTYSSGMYSRLAFSITANLETDIMMVDEVLSVGDLRFRKKANQRMEELITAERHTAIIVSHDSSNIRKLCNRVLWLDKGEVRMIGEPEEVLEAYAAQAN